MIMLLCTISVLFGGGESISQFPSYFGMEDTNQWMQHQVTPKWEKYEKENPT